MDARQKPGAKADADMRGGSILRMQRGHQQRIDAGFVKIQMETDQP